MSDLLLELETGITTFTYVKTDGTRRKCYGTRNKNLIPEYINKEAVTELVETTTNLLSNLDKYKDLVEEGGDPLDTMSLLSESISWAASALKPFDPKEKKAYTSNDEWVNYYDFEAKGWRKFKVASVVID